MLVCLFLIELRSGRKQAIGAIPCVDWFVDIIPGLVGGSLYIARSIRDFRLLAVDIPPSEMTEEAVFKKIPRVTTQDFATAVLATRRKKGSFIYYAHDVKNSDCSHTV